MREEMWPIRDSNPIKNRRTKVWNAQKVISKLILVDDAAHEVEEG